MKTVLNIKHVLMTFIQAIYAGLCIGVGGTVYLMCTSKLLGAFLFAIGLLAILLFKFKLFTGMTGYILENRPSYLVDLVITWFGNLAGTSLVAWLISKTRLTFNLDFVEIKLTDTWYSLFILGIFCGLLMFIGVSCFKYCFGKIDNTFALVMPIFCVAVFILAGFEHCVADMFYFALSGKLIEGFSSLLIITAGNILGGILIPVVNLLSKGVKNGK
jgi:formate/nitrite transporter FocA (FNT family)